MFDSSFFALRKTANPQDLSRGSLGNTMFSGVLRAHRILVTTKIVLTLEIGKCYEDVFFIRWFFSACVQIAQSDNATHSPFLKQE